MKAHFLIQKFIFSSLERYFDENNISNPDEIINEISIAFPGANSNVFQDIRLFLKKNEINNDAIANVFDYLTPLQKDFIIYKYKNKKPLPKIACLLGVPCVTLHKWNDDFLTYVQDELLFNINSDKIFFYYNKLDHKIEKLNNNINFLTENDNINKKIIKKMILKLNHYKEYNYKIKNALDSLNEKKQNVIFEKYCTTSASDVEVADKLNISRSLVSTYINEFKNIVKK